MATGQVLEHALPLGFHGTAALVINDVSYRRSIQFAHGPPAQMGDYGVFLVPWDWVPLRPREEGTTDVAVAGILRRGHWEQLRGREPEELVSVKWIYDPADLRGATGLLPSDCALSDMFGDLPLAWCGVGALGARRCFGS
jgi:hypothetical protein